MTEPDRRWPAPATVAALVCGGVLFFAGLALGLAAAVRFKNALERSAAGCGLAVGHGMAWLAVAVSAAGVLVAALAIVAEYRARTRARPVAVVVAAVLAGAGLFGAALNLFIVHEIDTCAALFG
ncbi:MAG TPA: hypothetical protein VHF06_20650 [Pseudonocardiaceae bacterium]|nr:hypothetical protein [Pseudonocardiaceae bacterium]